MSSSMTMILAAQQQLSANPSYSYSGDGKIKWMLGQTRGRSVMASAAKSGGFSIHSGCKTCHGKGAVECPGCKGTGKNKKNRNIFERWKCFDCQGFGLKSCPSCGKGGLTPEQRKLTRRLLVLQVSINTVLLSVLYVPRHRSEPVYRHFYIT